MNKKITKKMIIKKMIIKKITCMLILLAFLPGTLSGCGYSAQVGEEINISLNGSPTSVDPQLVSDTTSGYVASFFTACLYGYDEDRKLYPVLAEGYDLSEDGLTYTFHLKKDLKWSDGRPLTAADFVFGFRRLADPDVGSNSVYLITDSCQIKNAEKINEGKIPVSELGVYAPDDLTFVVELETPCPYICALLTMSNFAPCNEDFFHSVGNDYASNENCMLSCGPYIMDRYEPLAMQIHFTKNPYYVDEEQIRIPGANLQVVANAQQAMMSYESGFLDIISISGELTELAEGDPELKEFPAASLIYLNVNHRTCEPLKNRNIRMALSKSLDREDFVKNVLRTGNAPLTRVNPPGYYLETDGSDFAADQDQYRDVAGYDPQKAKELWGQGLKEIGKTEVSITLMYPTGNDSITEAIKAQMEKNLPGLTIELKVVPQKEAFMANIKGGYDLLYTGWYADYADPTSFLALFTSDYSVEGYDNPQFNEVYDKIQGAEFALNPEERNKLMHKAEDMLMEDAALIPLYTRGEAFLIKENVTGFELTPTGVGCIVTSLVKEVK